MAWKASVAYFGKPQETRPLGSFVDAPAHITGGFGYEKRDEYRWCDEQRLVVFNVKGRNYTLWIEPR